MLFTSLKMTESTPTSTPTPSYSSKQKGLYFANQTKSQIFCNVKTMGKNDFIRPTFL